MNGCLFDVTIDSTEMQINAVHQYSFFICFFVFVYLAAVDLVSTQEKICFPLAAKKRRPSAASSQITSLVCDTSTH